MLLAALCAWVAASDSLAAAAAPAASAASPGGWSEPQTLIQRTTREPEDQDYHVTVMDVRGKVANAHDRFYMWTWTHDTRAVRLYSAPRVAGPWTHRSTTELPFPRGYGLHVSAGDVVWDPRRKLFLASPHSVHVNPYHQATFMMVSDDGEDWRYARRDRPAVPVGPKGSFDNVHAGYGRFLRRANGDAVRTRGRLAFFYRGAGTLGDDGRYGASVSGRGGYRTWRKVNGGRPLFDPGGPTHEADDEPASFYLGSVVKQGAGVTMLAGVENVMVAKQAPGVFNWHDGPGTALFTDAGAHEVQGGSLVRTRRAAFLVYAASRIVGVNGASLSAIRFVRKPR